MAQDFTKKEQEMIDALIKDGQLIFDSEKDLNQFSKKLEKKLGKSEV